MAKIDLNKCLYIGLFSLISCSSADKEATSDNVNYIESSLGFYDPSDRDFTLNSWIRKPENIRAVHETFKKYGYSKIFSDYDLTSNPCMIWSYVNRPCVDIIDSLILTYPQKESSPGYYKEFWERRGTEKNDTTVFSVLNEIKEELINRNQVSFNEELVNDTIYHLLKIKYKRPDDEQEAQDNLDYLVKIGLHLSAYNMLYELSMYDNLKWDRDQLRKKLRTDTLYCCVNPIIEDDTK